MSACGGLRLELLAVDPEAERGVRNVVDLLAVHGVVAILERRPLSQHTIFQQFTPKHA